MPDYDLGTARGRIDLDASSLGRASAAFTGLGKAMIGVGAIAVGAFAYAVKSAADFEKQMSAVGAVSQATAGQMAAMKEVALELGSTTVFGANEIGRAMEQLAKAGVTVPDILGGATKAVVNLAAAAGDELAGGVDQAAVVMANAMKTFNVGADQAQHFADVLVGAAASSTLSVDDIATSMTYAGPAAAAMGLSIDDLATSLAILGDRGIRGSTAGTSLRGVLLGLATQTPKATKVMEKLGLITADGTNRFFELNGTMKPMPEVMQILGDATKNLGDQERFAAFNAIFQRRAMNSAMILAEQGAAGFDKYAAAIEKLKAADIAAKKLDNLSGDMTLLKNAVQTLMIRVGLPFQEMIRGWVQALNGLVRKLNDVNPELLAQIALYSAIGGAVLIAAGSFLYMVGIAIKLYKNFVILVEGIKLVAAAVKLLTISFLTNPVFLFIAAIVALIAIFVLAYKHSDEFRNRVDAAFSALQPVLQPIIRFVENFITQIGNLVQVFKDWDDVAQGVAEVVDSMFGNTGNLVGPIREIVKAIQQFDDKARQGFEYFQRVVMPMFWDFADAVGRTIVQVVKWLINTGVPAIIEFAQAVVREIGSVVEWFGKNVAPVFADVFGAVEAAIDRIIRVLAFFVPYFKMVWDRAFSVLRFAWKMINTFAQNVQLVWSNFSDNIIRTFTFLWTMVKQILESGLRIIRGVITLFTGLISGDWGKAWDGIKAIFSGIWSLIIDILQTALGAIWLVLSNAVDLVISVWEVGWNTVSDVVGGVLQLIKDFIMSWITFVTDMFKAGWELIKSTVNNVWQAMWSGIKNFAMLIHTTIWNFIVGIVQFFAGLWGQITGALGDMATKAYLFFYGAFQRGKDGIVEIVQSILQYARNIPQMILTAMGDIANFLFDAGKKIIQGLIRGIKSMAGAVGDAIGSVAGEVASWLPGSPVKKGPLMVLNRGYAGAQILKMLEAGIKTEGPKLQAMMNMQLGGIGLAGSSGASLSASAASPGSGGQSISITLEFPNITSAQEAQGVKESFDDQVLSKLVSAMKAGRL